MTNKCYSTDGESFYHNSLGEMLDDLESEGELYEGRVYYEADYRPLEVKDYASSNTVARILENLDEQIYDDIGECYDNDCYNVSKEAREEFRAFLDSWIAKHVNLSRYFKIVGKPTMVIITKEDLG